MWRNLWGGKSVLNYFIQTLQCSLPISCTNWILRNDFFLEQKHYCVTLNLVQRPIECYPGDQLLGAALINKQLKMCGNDWMLLLINWESTKMIDEVQVCTYCKLRHYRYYAELSHSNWCELNSLLKHKLNKILWTNRGCYTHTSIITCFYPGFTMLNSLSDCKS